MSGLYLDDEDLGSPRSEQAGAGRARPGRDEQQVLHGDGGRDRPDQGGAGRRQGPGGEEREEGEGGSDGDRSCQQWRAREEDPSCLRCGNSVGSKEIRMLRQIS